MEQIPYFQRALNFSYHNYSGKQSLIKNLETLYKENEVPVGNSGLARQRSLGNDACFRRWFFCSPHVQWKVDGKGVILFDDRLVDVNHLEDHPLLYPSFLHDHWSEMVDGALPVPSGYFFALMELSQSSGSGVRRLFHRDVGEIDGLFPLVKMENNSYLKAFLGLSDEERKAYLKEHGKRFEETYLGCDFNDARQKTPLGRLSVFGGYDNLNGGGSLDSFDANLLGINSALLDKRA